MNNAITEIITTVRTYPPFWFAFQFGAVFFTILAITFAAYFYWGFRESSAYIDRAFEFVGLLVGTFVIVYAITWSIARVKRWWQQKREQRLQQRREPSGAANDYGEIPFTAEAIGEAIELMELRIAAAREDSHVEDGE